MMPAGMQLTCESFGPLGMIGSQGAVVFLEGGAPQGRSTVGVLNSSRRKVTKVATCIVVPIGVVQSNTSNNSFRPA
jgi:hypothetical protein